MDLRDELLLAGLLFWLSAPLAGQTLAPEAVAAILGAMMPPR